MSGYDQVTWFPLCAGLTLAGLAGSWLALRRRGAAAGLRGAAWSLLPLAAYLTGVVALLWRIGVAFARWVGGFVFSPTVWSGVVVAGVSALLFAVSAALRRRAPAGGDARRDGERADAGSGTGSGPALTRREQSPAGRRRAKTSVDDDFADVEEILRKRGIS